MSALLLAAGGRARPFSAAGGVHRRAVPLARSFASLSRSLAPCPALPRPSARGLCPAEAAGSGYAAPQFLQRDRRSTGGGRGPSLACGGKARRSEPGAVVHVACFLRRFRTPAPGSRWQLCRRCLMCRTPGHHVLPICDAPDPQGSPLPAPGSHLQPWLGAGGECKL